MGWVRAKDVAEHLSVSLTMVKRWTANEGLPHSKIGRCVLYSLDDVDEWVRTRTPPTKAERPRRKRRIIQAVADG